MSINTGRWTDEEHSKFIEALQLYGKEWKKVQEHVGTRTSTQARSHAQKYFFKMEKKAASPEIKFTPANTVVEKPKKKKVMSVQSTPIQPQQEIFKICKNSEGIPEFELGMGFAFQKKLDEEYAMSRDPLDPFSTNGSYEDTHQSAEPGIFEEEMVMDSCLDDYMLLKE